MKKIIGFITIVLILITLGYFLHRIYTKMQAKKEAISQIEVLPNFSLIDTNNNNFSNADLTKGMQTVFVFFNSDCDFCQHEAQSIHDELHQFKNVQFLFISSEDINTIQEFATQYQLINKSNITFLYDRNSLFSSELDIQLIPTVLIYNEQKKLLKKHKGQLNANGILKIINKH